MQAEQNALVILAQKNQDSYAFDKKVKQMSKWLEVNVIATHAAAEAVAELLQEIGSKGVAIEDPLLLNELRASGTWELCDIPEQEDTESVTVSGYYPLDEKIEERLARIEAELAAIKKRVGADAIKETSSRTLCEEDWANAWKEFFHVTHVGKNLVIKPSWEEYHPKEGEHVLMIDPGMAFGTGTHHTTNMMMELLENAVHPDAVVFDVGTGSGILAIAAALLGAQKITAVDIDAVAVRVAQENVAANNLQAKISVHEGDLLHGLACRADIIIANIIADVIIALLPDIPARLAPGGIFLASGIIRERMEDVLRAASAQGLALMEKRERGGWAALQFAMRD